MQNIAVSKSVKLNEMLDWRETTKMRKRLKRPDLITIRIEPAVRTRLTNLAEREERSLTWMVNRLLVEGLDRREILNDERSKANEDQENSGS